IIERRYSKDRDAPLSLREAATDVSFTRKMEGAQALIDQYGLTEQAYAAGQAMNLPEPPPPQLGMLTEKGELREPIGNRRITDDDAISAHQAAKEVGNFRELAEAQRQQLLAQLELQTAQREAEAAKPAPQPQPQPAQQQPPSTAVQQEQARLEA